MDVLLNQWKTFAVSTTDAIATWARPAHHAGHVSPMASWPLASGYSAFSIAFGYLAFVLVFSSLMKRTCTVRCALCTVRCALCAVRCMLCAVYCVLCAVCYVLCAIVCN